MELGFEDLDCFEDVFEVVGWFTAAHEDDVGDEFFGWVWVEIG